MPTTSHIRTRGQRSATLALAACSLAALCLSLAATSSNNGAANASRLSETDDDDAPGSALPVTGRPAPDAIAATFTQRSYRPGETADLRIATPASHLSLRVYRAGGGHDGALRGAPVTAAITLGRVAATRIRVGNWPSGLYYLRLTAPRGLHGYAPFVIRPRHLGENRIAVVLPTNTWQAYNFYDEDRDGRPDSWYADSRVSGVDLARPFLDHGIPPHYTGYDRGFVRWLARSGKQVDFLTDDDLERIGSGDQFARNYDLIVFSGHEEYVTSHAYDITERYRDLGGNLMFLSANNFFYRVDRHDNHICRTGRWRDLGRPEASLVGIQYVDWYQERYANRPYVVTCVDKVPRAFHGTGLDDGESFGKYGIEIDARTSDSPAGIRVLARIPNVFGPGKSAEMTYYTTAAKAKVFAAGVINFGGSVLWPTISPILDNLWKEMRKP
jgi:hypothetical protein